MNHKTFTITECTDYEWLHSNGMKIFSRGDASDGYHTFSELYEHRYALFAALVKVYDGYKTPLGCNVTCYKSRLHHDGTMLDDSFIVMMVIQGMATKDIKQISYHLPLSWWDKFNIMELKRMWEWDGHTSDDVLERLMEL